MKRRYWCFIGIGTTLDFLCFLLILRPGCSVYLAFRSWAASILLDWVHYLLNKYNNNWPWPPRCYPWFIAYWRNVFLACFETRVHTTRPAKPPLLGMRKRPGLCQVFVYSSMKAQGKSWCGFSRVIGTCAWVTVIISFWSRRPTESGSTGRQAAAASAEGAAAESQRNTAQQTWIGVKFRSRATWGQARIYRRWLGTITVRVRAVAFPRPGTRAAWRNGRRRRCNIVALVIT
jgi:hypothetical protein